MAKNLSTLYPGKIDIDANNPNGTFKNRTSDALKDGTPYEKGWGSDVWGFLSHILKKALVSPSGAEENETNSQYYDALEGLVGRRAVKFESEDLIINAINNTQAIASFKRLSLLDSNFIPKFLNDKNLTWNMPADLEAGTSEKASHNYGMWVDSDEVLRFVPDLTGTTDSTVAGSIADSTATWLTDLVHDGDIVYNLTTLQKTKASADAAAEGQFTLEDDIFTSGDSYKIVKMSPEGLGENRERIGAAYNNGSSNFDDSTYTQIQERKFYSVVAGDFTITSSGTGWATVDSIAEPYQVNDWTGLGVWKLFFAFHGTTTAVVANPTITLSGITAKTGVNQQVSFDTYDSGISTASGQMTRTIFVGGGSGIMSPVADIASDTFMAFATITLDNKPIYHN